MTGPRTGWSPLDRFIVKDSSTASDVWWGDVNRPIGKDVFDGLHMRVAAYLRGRDVFVQDLSPRSAISRRASCARVCRVPPSLNRPWMMRTAARMERSCACRLVTASITQSPCFQLAAAQRLRPAPVRGPVLPPPCIPHRPFAIAGPLQFPPARVRAPHRGADEKSPGGLP
jgi:hypothetical protein